eukprot:882569-Amorphochlora_amoeboformis.AAC.2
MREIVKDCEKGKSVVPSNYPGSRRRFVGLRGDCPDGDWEMNGIPGDSQVRDSRRFQVLSRRFPNNSRGISSRES